MIAALLLLLAWSAGAGDGIAGDRVHVGCAESGPACAQTLQAAIDAAPAGTTITLDPGKVYDGTIVIKPKVGAADEKRLTITTRGWTDKGQGWNGLVTPDDKPRMAVLRGSPRASVALDVRNGRGGGYINVFGIAFEATPPAGQGEIIRIGSGKEQSADNLARQIAIRQVLLQGSRDFGQKRGVTANGRDIDISQIWCEEMFIAGQDAQCVGAYNGGKHVTVRYAYLAAGGENLILGGAPIASAEMRPEDWTIEDVILHKPLRWQEDGRNRQVKNLLELKHGARIIARRILAVNNWRAAQDGTALLLNYTTNGNCPECGNLENVLIEDLVMLNVAAGVSFQGYSWQRDSHNGGKLRDVTLRNAYIQLSKAGRAIQIANVLHRHDIRVERSTFINQGPSWLIGSYGRVWTDDETSTKGGPMEGVWLVDNVFTSNGRYGITAPDGEHFGEGIGRFVDQDLQIAGNVFGDAPVAQLANYNKYKGDGAANVSASRGDMTSKLTGAACAEWTRGKGADCARLAPIFELLKRLPEP